MKIKNNFLLHTVRFQYLTNVFDLITNVNILLFSFTEINKDKWVILVIKK